MVHKTPSTVNSNEHLPLKLVNLIRASPWILFTFSVAAVEQLKKLLSLYLTRGTHMLLLQQFTALD